MASVWYTFTTQGTRAQKELSWKFDNQLLGDLSSGTRHTSDHYLKKLSKYTRRKSLTNVFKWLPQFGELAQSLFYNISGPLVDFAVLVGVTTDGTFYSLGGKSTRGHRENVLPVTRHGPWPLGTKARTLRRCELMLSHGLLCLCGLLCIPAGFLSAEDVCSTEPVR